MTDNNEMNIVADDSNDRTPAKGGVRRSKTRSLTFRIIVCIGALVLSLLAAEGVVRLLPESALGFVEEDGDFAPARQRPKDEQMNSSNYHDVEHAVAKPSGVRRVLLLGDSYVRAGAVTVPETPGQRLEYYLNRDARGGRRYEVIAMGWGAWGQLQELEVLRRDGLRYAPDIVVTLFLSFNDISDNSAELSRRATEHRANYQSFRPGRTRLAEKDMPWLLIPQSKLNQLLSYRLAYLYRDKTVAGIPPSYYVYALDEDDDWRAAWKATYDLFLQTKQEVEAAGALYRVVAASTPHGVFGAEDGLARLTAEYPGMAELRWDLDQPDSRIEELCRTNGIPFLALEPLSRVETVEKGRELHFPVNGHWNPEGNDFAADKMAEFLLSLEPAP